MPESNATKGEPFGRYRLLELIGQGGMGQVYRAFDTSTDRVVALKVLPPHTTDDPEFEQRFRREAHIAAGLTDPHVIPIHSYGEIDGRLYLDMRLIDGRDLALVLKDKPLPPSKAVHYIEQVAEALNAAHSADLVHRDVKPSNILITPRDFVYLIDFGIARGAAQTRVTNTGHTIGTFRYMAPERFDGQSEPCSDVYALACVLYECLTGKPPFAGDSLEQQIAAHVLTPPPRPSTSHAKPPTAFDSVIEKGMAKDVSDRYQTALELAAAARGALASTGRTPSKTFLRRDTKTAIAREPEPPAAVSPSAATLTAPTRVVSQNRAILKPRQPENRTYWTVLWLVLLVAALALAGIVWGLV